MKRYQYEMKSTFNKSLQMKIQRILLIATGWLALFLALAARSQNYSINWYTIGSGGGTSTGSVYSVSATIGQPAAGGPLTGGQYSVTDGFWALPTAVQVAGAPTLTIARSGPGQVTISWPPEMTGYILQETALLSPANWTNSLSGGTNPVTVPMNRPAKFYRLFKP